MNFPLDIMTSSTDGMLINSTIDSGGANDNITTLQQPSTGENISIPGGCIQVRFNQLGYIPWNNPDNIVSAEVEVISRRVQQNTLALLFLIGGPANVINMAVFYKQGLQDRVNLCLFALSLADLLHLMAAIFLHGEQLHMQFTSTERYGPVMTFMVNNNLVGFFGFQWVAQILTAVIASERCLCVLSPLKFQTLFRTRTMAIIIATVYTATVGLFFLVAFRYRVACVYDPGTGVVLKTGVTGELYEAHKELVNYLNGLIFGGGLPVTVIIVVTTTTMITTIKLRQIMTWRTGTSSVLSPREVALTKMLVGNSILFIACVIPDALFRFVCVFLPEMNAGRRNQNFYMSCLWILDIITYINSSFNIFVYYTMGSRYRATLSALFRRQNQPDKTKQRSK